MAFAGKIYFIAQLGDLVCCWDTNARKLTMVPRVNAALPGNVGTTSGANNLLSTTVGPTGNVLVERKGASVALATGELIGFSEGLGVVVSFWTIPAQYDSPRNTINWNYIELDTPLYDPVAGVYWTRYVCGEPDALWHVTGLDPGTGARVRYRGDALAVHPVGGFDYAGLSNQAPNLALLGRWLYSNMTFGGSTRLNLDTGAWQSLADRTSDNVARAVQFLGVDEKNGHLITLNTVPPNSTDYVGHRYWIQVRNPETPAWVTASEWFDISSLNRWGEPLAEYPPPPMYGGAYPAFIDDYRPRPIAIHDGQAIMVVAGGYGIDYGFDDASQMWGNSWTVWTLDLTNGTWTKISDIPYQAVNENGDQVPGDYAGAWWFGGESEVYGTSVVPETMTITGQLDRTRVRFL